MILTDIYRTFLFFFENKAVFVLINIFNKKTFLLNDNQFFMLCEILI